MTSDHPEDVFRYDRAQSDMNPNYFDQFENLISYDNTFSLFPDQGGITSPYDKLRIWVELLNASPYKYFTIEVHNPEQCNLKSFYLKRRDMFLELLETEPIASVFLRNKVAIIDIEYNKNFYKVGGLSDEVLTQVQILELGFLTSTDGKNPGSCELRAFASRMD